MSHPFWGPWEIFWGSSVVLYATISHSPTHTPHWESDLHKIRKHSFLVLICTNGAALYSLLLPLLPRKYLLQPGLQAQDAELLIFSGWNDWKLKCFILRVSLESPFSKTFNTDFYKSTHKLTSNVSNTPDTKVGVLTYIILFSPKNRPEPGSYFDFTNDETETERFHTGARLHRCVGTRTQTHQSP